MFVLCFLSILTAVIPQPQVHIVPYSKGSDILKFTVYDYSKNFIVLIFKRDDKEFKNNSDPGYFTVSELDPPSTAAVQVVLHFQLSGTYKLCYEFRNFSDPVYNGGRNCTNGQTVKINGGIVTKMSKYLHTGVFVSFQRTLSCGQYLLPFWSSWQSF